MGWRSSWEATTTNNKRQKWKETNSRDPSGRLFPIIMILIKERKLQTWRARSRGRASHTPKDPFSPDLFLITFVARTQHVAALPPVTCTYHVRRQSSGRTQVSWVWDKYWFGSGRKSLQHTEEIVCILKSSRSFFVRDYRCTFTEANGEHKTREGKQELQPLI